jgi:hypothetical protein
MAPNTSSEWSSEPDTAREGPRLFNVLIVQA